MIVPHCGVSRILWHRVQWLSRCYDVTLPASVFAHSNGRSSVSDEVGHTSNPSFEVVVHDGQKLTAPARSG